MKKLIFFLPILVFLAACGGSKDPVGELNAKVMEVHDSSMVKMDIIYTTLGGLREMKKTLDADSTNENNSIQNEVEEAITRLSTADDAMMDWMHDYSAPKKDTPVDENIKYLEGQMESIIKVDKQMDESIANGRKVLSKAKNE